MTNTVLKKYSARKMLARSTEELKARLKGNFILVFDDGSEAVTNATETIYSSYFWDILRKYSFTPITAEMHVGKVIKGGLATSGTHLRLFERIAYGVMDAAEAQNLKVDADDLGLMIYQKTNELYNYACVDLESEVITTDITHYVSLLKHPLVVPVLEALEPTEESISKTYAAMTELVMKSPELSDNPLCISARAGMVKMNQLLQCLVARGFVTDIDSFIFSEPSMGNFSKGYEDFYSLLIDSRTASKSLFFSAKLLRQTEYSSRKMQILCMSLETLHPGDCGSQSYLPWLLRPEKRDENGKVVRRADAEFFYGKYFLDEDTGKIKELKPAEAGKYLGKVMRFRSPLAGCAHPDPHGVCMTCFGAMGKTIPPNTNIGHLVAAALMNVLSQSILSVKHIDSSSSSAPITIPEDYREFLTTNTGRTGYMLAKGLKNKKVSLILSQNDMANLSSINTTDDIYSLAIEQISEISMGMFKIEDGIETMNIPIEFEADKRRASLTHAALLYIKEVGWTNDERGNYVIDLNKWHNKSPLMLLPQRHFNTADHAEAITKLIQGTSDERTKRKQEGSVFTYFYELFELVNNRLSVPAVILENIIFGASIRSAENGDYRMPRAGTSRQMGLTGKTVPFRSMGAGFGFEKHVSAIFSADIFDPEYRSSHVFDAYVMPQETIEDRNRKGLA